MKPKIGKTVYCIYEISIEKLKVGFIGRDSFIIDDFNDSRMFDSLQWFYEDYNKTWFTSLKNAKNQLIKEQNELVELGLSDPNFKIVQINDNYWEIQDV